MRGLRVLLFLAGSLLWGRIYPYAMHPEANATLPGIAILDQKQMVYDTIGAVPFSEVSDLAYFPQSHTLIMLSDKGRLYTFSASFSQDKITLRPQTASFLQNADGKRLKKAYRDSEGLARGKQDELAVSFEGRPRVAIVDRHGRIVRDITLPKPLRSLRQYRGRNKGLEALAWHPKYGWLVAKERPRKGPLVNQAVYSLSGRVWRFKAENIPGDSVTAIEVMDDGNLLVLERAFDRKKFLGVVTLKKVYLERVKNGWCQTKVLAQMRTDKGWMIDNFEGLTRVAPHRYLMVSDDNDNFFQKTLLIYFEVRD